MIKRFFFMALSLLVFMISCSDEGEEQDESAPSTSHFSDAELSVLNQSLNLNAQLFNYSNLQLPRHYKTDNAYESDNTPEWNPISNIGATLGRVLFYDKNLSANNAVSCASCHKQNLAFADNAAFSEGLNGGLTDRNTMGLINARYYENGRFLWDERAESLEEQVLLPIQDHTEMGMDLADLVIKLQALDYYTVLFEKTFGSAEITTERIARALSQFIRSIVSINSKYDQGLIAINSDGENPLSLPNFTAQENLGMDIFLRRATCVYCHGTAQFVNDEAKNNGLELSYTDPGKGGVTGHASDQATFKVPSLRNVALTAPYMHDGRFQTLMEVVNHYSDNVQAHPNLNFRLTNEVTGEVLRLQLSQSEKEALVAFLETLTDHDILTDEKYSDPFK